MTNLVELKEAEAWRKYIIWIADIETDCENISPVWVGWNPNLISRNNETQKMRYLQRLNMPPTFHAGVAETLKKCLSITAECEKQCVFVKYHLVTTKIAYQI